jgi:hypothetical protein
LYKVLVGKPEGKRDLLEDRGVDGGMGSEWILNRLTGRLSGFSWLSLGTSGELLWMRWWTFGFWRHGFSYIILVMR